MMVVISSFKLGNRNGNTEMGGDCVDGAGE